MSPEYDLYQLFIEPHEVGHSATNRRRTYVICAHRLKTYCIDDPFEVFQSISKAVKKHCREMRLSPEHLMVANTQEVQEEALRVSASRGIPYNPDSGSDLRYLLLPREELTRRGLDEAYFHRFRMRLQK